MNRYQILAAFLLASCSLIACNSNPDNMGSSTPIDSSNLYGAPGATYGADNPADPKPPKYEGQYDTGMQANTMNHDDSVNQGLLTK